MGRNSAYRFLLRGRSEKDPYFPLSKEEELYIDRDGLEETILKKILEKENRVLLVKGSDGHGNTSFLNHIMLKLYSTNPPYNRDIISLQASEKEKNTLLRTLFPKIWQEPPTPWSKIKVRYLKLKTWGRIGLCSGLLILYALVGVLVYLLLVYLGSLSTGNIQRLPLWIHIPVVLLSVFIPGWILFLANKVSKKILKLEQVPTESMEYDEMLINVLETRITKVFAKNVYGTYLFIDDADSLDPESQKDLLFNILPKMKSYNINACVILYKDEASPFAMSVSERYSKVYEKFVLRKFTPSELELAAELNRKDLSNIDLSMTSMAGLMIGLSRPETEAFQKQWTRLHDTGVKFNRQLFLAFSYFAPFESNRVPARYVMNLLKFLESKYSQISGIPVRTKWEYFVKNFNDSYSPVMVLLKNEYLRNPCYYKLMKDAFLNSFSKQDLFTLGRVYHIWGSYNYLERYPLYKRKDGRSVVRRFADCLAQSETDYPNLSMSQKNELMSITTDGLVEAGEYFYLKDLEFSYAYDVLLEILDRAKEMDQFPRKINEAVRTAIQRLLEIYFYTGHAYLVDEVRRYLSVKKKDAAELPSGIKHFLTFEELIRGKEEDNSRQVSNTKVETEFADIVNAFCIIKEKNLWSNLAKTVNRDILPKVKGSQTSFNHFYLHFLRAEVFDIGGAHQLFGEEIGEMLIRFYMFKESKRKLSALEKCLQHYFEAHVLHFLFSYLSKGVSQNRDILDMVQEVFPDIDTKSSKIVRRQIYTKSLEKYSLAEFLCFRVGAIRLLVDLYFGHARLLYGVYRKAPEDRQHEATELWSLLEKAYAIEREAKISLRSPFVLFLRAEFLDADRPEISKHELEKLYKHLKQYNYPLFAKLHFLRRLIYRLHAYAEADSEIRDRVSYAEEYLRYLDLPEATNLRHTLSYSDTLLEGLEIKLLIIVQGLKELGLSQKALEEIEKIEHTFRLLPEELGVKELRLAKDIIKHDVLRKCQGKEADAMSICRSLYDKLRSTWDKLSIQDHILLRVALDALVHKARITHEEKIILSERDEIIKRLPDNLSREEIVKIAKIFAFEESLFPRVEYKHEFYCHLFPDQYLEAGENISWRLKDFGEIQTMIKILRNLWHIAKTRRLVKKFERDILQQLIDFDQDDSYNMRYRLRWQEIMHVVKEMSQQTVLSAVEEIALDKVRTEIGTYSKVYAPENAPETIKNKRMRSEQVFYTGKIESLKELIKELEDWYSSEFDPSSNLYYEELVLLEILVKSKDRLEPNSPKTQKLKKDLFFLNRKKILSECDKLEFGVADPELADLMKFIRSKVLEVAPQDSEPVI
jgi:hypothetical protein